MEKYYYDHNGRKYYFPTLAEAQRGKKEHESILRDKIVELAENGMENRMKGKLGELYLNLLDQLEKLENEPIKTMEEQV